VYVAYIQLAGSVLFNVASYVVYKAIGGLPPRVWWPLFFVGLILGAINALFSPNNFADGARARIKSIER
jgi:hypothetical protein